MKRKKSSLPLITVGITCYNAEKTIRRAVDSALSQDWPNYEVIVVDDGSTDNSLKILRESSNSFVKVIEHSGNFGCSHARNTIINNAKGEFIVFFDDDDVSLPQRLQLQFKCIVSHENKTNFNLIACYTSGNRIYPNDYVKPIKAVGTEGLSPVGKEMVDYLLFNKQKSTVFYGAGSPACSLMARSSVFKIIGGFDTAMKRQEDIDFAIRLGMAGGHFIGIPEIQLLQYFTTGNEKSAFIEFESFIKIINKNENYLKRNGSYHYMLLWSEMRYRYFEGQNIKAMIILLRLIYIYPIRTIKHFSYSAARRFRHEWLMNNMPK